MALVAFLFFKKLQKIAQRHPPTVLRVSYISLLTRIQSKQFQFLTYSLSPLSLANSSCLSAKSGTAASDL